MFIRWVKVCCSTVASFISYWTYRSRIASRKVLSATLTVWGQISSRCAMKRSLAQRFQKSQLSRSALLSLYNSWRCRSMYAHMKYERPHDGDMCQIQISSSIWLVKPRNGCYPTSRQPYHDWVLDHTLWCYLNSDESFDSQGIMVLLNFDLWLG